MAKGGAETGSLSGSIRSTAIRVLATPSHPPPATLITRIVREGGALHIRGIATDNAEVAKVLVNGTEAKITSQHAGVAEWEITLPGTTGDITAKSRDAVGNEERWPHKIAGGHFTGRAQIPQSAGTAAR